MSFTKKSLKLLPPSRISCGHQFTLAATDAGELFGWGDNRNAKLGLSIGPEIVWRPTKIQSETISGSINEVSCGSEFSLCIVLSPGENISEAGTLLGWGVNSYGQTGVVLENDPNLEVRIPSPVHITEKVCRISCGSDFAGCISEKGRLYTWGRGNNGNLGHGSTDSYPKPTIVQALSDHIMITLSCGSKHMCAITSNFRIYSWGNGGHGRLGHGDTTGTATPKLIEGLSNENIMQVSCGDSHTSAVSTLGVVYSWGCGSYGRLGQGSEGDIFIPSIISTFTGKRMYLVACGFRHTLALSIHGEVFSWGAGNYGVTGLFDIKDMRSMLVPLKIQFLEGKKVTQIAVGAWHSVVITSAGETWTWGYHGHGRLGLGSEVRTDQPFPKQIPSDYIYGITGGLRIVERIAQVTGSKQLAIVGGARDAWKIVSVACGAQFSLALTKSGTVWIWGESKNGALGIGEKDEDQQVPTICSGLNNYIISSVACGSQHCIAITTQGEALSWGNGKYGQLGTGHLGICFVPKLITMMTGKTPILASCGEDFSLIMTEMGEVYSFGNGESGKLGHGNENKQIFPKLIHELVNIIYISAGMSHSACIAKDGTISTWGAGFFGRLGLGSNYNYSVPKRIHSKVVRRYKTVSCGSYHTLMIDTDGELYGMGKKELLLTNYEENEPKFLQFFFGMKFDIICAGEDHSLAVTADGDTYAWGINKYGKLGNNTESESGKIPYKLDLPSSIASLSCRINHNLALTQAGEIYCWGCGSGGRLGFGSSANVKAPKLLQTRWITLSDKSDGNNLEEEANALDMILSQLETGVRITSFKEVMMILQNESHDCIIDEIRKNEEFMIGRFNDILRSLIQCKAGEEKCLALVNEFEGRILQRSFELKLPQRDYLKVLVPAYIASKLPQLEKLLWILQQQPCYISRLVSTMQQRGAKDLPVLIKSIRILYSNFSSNPDKSRELLLYLALCKEVISREIENATKIEELFTTSTCPSAEFLLTFFSREYGSELYFKILSRAINETMGMIEAVGVSGFAINPADIAKIASRKSLGSAQSIVKVRKARQDFEDGITYVIRAVGLFIDSFKAFPGTLPNSIKILLKHAFNKMVNKAWLKETTQEPLKKKFHRALLHLLIVQLMVPVIIAPENEGLHKKTITNEERALIGTLADIIKKVIQNSHFIGEHYSHLNNFIQFSNESLQQSLESCLDVEDSSGVDLVVSIFLSHLNPEPNIIHFPVNDLVSTVVMFIKYRKNIELFKGRDAAYELLEQIGEIGSEVTHTVENYKVNLKINNNFLYDQGDVTICSSCSVPMPKSLAIIGDFQETIVKILRNDDTGFVECIERASRKIPKFSASSLEDLSESLKKVCELMTNVGCI